MIGAAFGSSGRSRLLPASVPLRYFGAAAVFHALAWAMLLAGAPGLPGFSGGLGTVFAALHSATLGVLAMTAIGASLQMLPVATRQPVRSVAAAKAVWWLLVPAVALFAGAGAAYEPRWLGPGAFAVAVALALYAWLLFENLRRARGMPAVRAYGWSALACLVLALAAGVALVAHYEHGIALDRAAFATAHLVLAAYGFMGLLAFGLAYFLLPMFAVAPAPPARLAWSTLGTALGAIVLSLVALAFDRSGIGLAGAAALGIGATALHWISLERAFARRLRGPLGSAFMLVRVSWACLAASLAVALGLALGWLPARAAVLFGVLLVPGWLLGFALAVLQRIVPFLATVHAAGAGRGAPLVSTFTPERPLAAHRLLHVAALAGLIAAVVLDSAVLAQLAALAGLAGALAYLVFFFTVLVRLRAERPAPPAQGALHGL